MQDVPISKLGLKKRTYRLICERYNPWSALELSRVDVRALLKIPYFGRKALEDLSMRLDEFGFENPIDRGLQQEGKPSWIKRETR